MVNILVHYIGIEESRQRNTKGQRDGTKNYLQETDKVHVGTGTKFVIHSINSAQVPRCLQLSLGVKIWLQLVDAWL